MYHRKSTRPKKYRQKD